MRQFAYCTAGSSPALDIAQTLLLRQGCKVLPVPESSATHLLLPVPSFDADGNLKGGNLEDVLPKLSPDVIVMGGGLNSAMLKDYRTVDFLKDPVYLAHNAAITAQCALRLLLWHLREDIRGCNILIIGWGRIGKCLAAALKALGANVSVAARKEADRAMLMALGYGAETPERVGAGLQRYRAVINTAPAKVLDETAVSHCRADCLKIDLASVKGLPGNDVLIARGLPGKDAPGASGRLIAQTVLRLSNKEG